MAIQEATAGTGEVPRAPRKRKERQAWVRQHAQEIVAFAQAHTRRQALAQFHVSFACLKKILAEAEALAGKDAVDVKKPTDQLLTEIVEMIELFVAQVGIRLEEFTHALSEQALTIEVLRGALQQKDEELKNLLALHNETIARRRIGKLSLDQLREAWGRGSEGTRRSRPRKGGGGVR